ncbi:hypothetical protein B7494_g8646 [Chlorociboria aeruginascens]|nr:hypothetical protein B7494_g8646 [Chlorociboria aeruginascens]
MAAPAPAGLEVNHLAGRRPQEQKLMGVNIDNTDVVDINHSKYVVNSRPPISRKPIAASTPYSTPTPPYLPYPLPIRFPSGRSAQSLLTTTTSLVSEDQKSVYPLSSVASMRGEDYFRMVEEENRRRRGERRILGLTAQTFWILMGIIMIIVAGGIGGGVVGGIMASKNGSSKKATVTNGIDTQSTAVGQSTSTASTSQTSTTPSAATTTYPVDSPCNDDPAASGEILTSGSSQFQLYCNTNWPEGAQYGNPNVTDITNIPATTMSACLAACVSYNGNVGSESCMAVAIEKAAGGKCVLKTGQGVNNTSTSGGTPLDAAFLVS